MPKLLICALAAISLLVLHSAAAEELRWSEYQLSVSCGLSKPESLEMVDGDILRFQVEAGDVGKCSTDSEEYRSDDWYKPYSERAEAVVEKKLANGKTHVIEFEARFVSGFVNSDRNETFFQIKDCPDSDVPVMAFLRTMQKSKPFAFHLGGDYVTARSPVTLRMNQWQKFSITYESTKPSRLTVTVDGKTIIDRVSFPFVNECGQTRFRIGIYRGGSMDTKLATSVVEYRNLTIN